jgi:hypothetical protein
MEELHLSLTIRPNPNGGAFIIAKAGNEESIKSINCLFAVPGAIAAILYAWADEFAAPADVVAP